MCKKDSLLERERERESKNDRLLEGQRERERERKRLNRCDDDRRMIKGS